MGLLLDDDYAYLAESGLAYVEVEAPRFLIFRDFRLPAGVYKSGTEIRDVVDVLYVIPGNYNASGGDMFWVYPYLERVDGKVIPNVNGPGQDSRTQDGIEYLRWSRHWHNKPWRPKIDNVQTIVDRITWAFAHPDAKRT